MDSHFRLAVVEVEAGRVRDDYIVSLTQSAGTAKRRPRVGNLGNEWEAFLLHRAE